MYNTERFEDLFNDTESSFDIEFGEIQSGGAGVPYAGPYSVTPTQFEQTLQTRGKTCVQDIVVQPIPRNYGLITYNGFEITVS